MECIREKMPCHEANQTEYSANETKNPKSLEIERICSPEKAPAGSSPIRSMKTYIQERYEREMIIELATKISSGEIPASRMPRYRTLKAVADPETGHIQSISFRRLTPCYVHADIIFDMAVTFPASDTHAEQRQFLSYRADFWIDLEDKIICDYGRFRCYTYEEPPDGRLLSGYLVPFLSHDDVEEEAEFILLRYCPEALHDPKLLNPWNLTRLNQNRSKRSSPVGFCFSRRDW